MKIFIRHMVSNRCKMLVKSELQKLGLHFILVELGEVEIMENITSEQRKLLQEGLFQSGLELIEDHKSILIERIKTIIIEMIHLNDEPPKTNFSHFLSQKLSHDYTYLANIFSESAGTTIEHYIINHKIERVKELLIYDELNLTEISYRLNYSSVAHLSNQFKKVTGLTPTFFKQLRANSRIPLENM